MRVLPYQRATHLQLSCATICLKEELVQATQLSTFLCPLPVAARSELIFKLKGERNGAQIHPDTWDVAELARYLHEVEDFIRPEAVPVAERSAEPITVRYEEGSAQLRTRLSAARRTRALFAVQALQPARHVDAEGRTAVGIQLEALHPKQRRVVHKWFHQAQAFGDVYQVLDPAQPDLPLLIIDRYTTIIEAEEDLWLPTELYLNGKVLELGGVNKTGLTIEVADGMRHKVAASQEQLEQQETNRVYHTVVLRAKAERNYQTGELRNLELVQFLDYAPRIDAAAHARASQHVSSAFSEINNLTDWVAQLRGA